MVKCFVPNCKSGYALSKRDKETRDKENHIAFFTPPKDEFLLQKWRIKIGRVDRVLDSTCKVCSLHFEEHDIRRTTIKEVNGVKVEQKLKFLKLTDRAVPTIYPGCPRYKTTISVKRKIRTALSPQVLEPTASINGDEHDGAPPLKLSRHAETHEGPQLNSQMCISQRGVMEFDNSDDAGEIIITLPPPFQSIQLPTHKWRYMIGKQPSVIYCFEVIQSKDGLVNEIRKRARIDMETKTIGYSVNKAIFPPTLKLPQQLPDTFDSADQVTTTLKMLESYSLCDGITAEDYHCVGDRCSDDGFFKDGVWRSNLCRLFLDGKQSSKRSCASCNLFKRSVLYRFLKVHKQSYDASSKNLNGQHMWKEEVSLKVKELRRENLALKAKIRRQLEKLKEKEAELDMVLKKFDNVEERVMEKIMEPLTDKAKLVVRTLLRRAKCRNKNGKDMKYEAEWLLESFLLSIKSPTTYDHIRSAGILPLPCRETLRSLLSSMSCHFGFNELALEAIEKALEGLGPNQCLGSLMWDEIAVTQDIMFNTQTLQFDEFSDDSEDFPEIDEEGENEMNTDLISSNSQDPNVISSREIESEPPQCRDEVEPNKPSIEPGKRTTRKRSNPKSTPKKTKSSYRNGRKKRSGKSNKNTLPECEVDASHEKPVENMTKEQDTTNCAVSGPVSTPPEAIPQTILNQTVPKLANHALVFAFRPYMSSWIQPFAVFSGHNSISGPKMYRLVVKALILLEARGARVLSTVCDGASNNCFVWKMFRISGRNSDSEVINNAIEHPTTKEPVYFLRDPPHLFKCIRNHFVTHKNVQAAGESVNFLYIQRMYDLDQLDLTGKKLCPRLRAIHLNPSNFQRMNVRLAVQLLSYSVGKSLEILRQHPEKTISDQFVGSESTEALILLLNETFDIMNARIPRTGITQDKWPEYKKSLEKLLVVVEKTEFARAGLSLEEDDEENIAITQAEGFASMITLNGLSVTNRSTIDIVDTLLKAGYHYVLTGKLNQDAIERFFGIIRSCGRDNDKPTISTFLQLFRMLSLYYPVKRVLRGSNVDNSEEQCRLLMSYKEWMKNRFKAEEKKHKENREIMKNILLNGITVELGDMSDELTDKEFSVNDNIIYYMCGYLVRSCRKAKHQCKECLKTLDVSYDILPKNFTADYLTQLKNKGGLAFCSTNLFQLTSIVEGILCNLVKSDEVFVTDSFQSVLYEISYEKLPPIGCEHHRIELMTNIIYDFVVNRFKYFAKLRKLKLLEESKTQRHVNAKLSKM